MAFGFKPKYIEEFYLDKFTSKQFLTIAIETAKKLQWQIDYISETGFIAFTNNGRWKWNAKITFKIDGSRASIKSECIGNEMFDWGKNKKVIEKFTNLFIDLKYSLKTEDVELMFEEIQNIVPLEQDILSKAPQTTNEKITDAFSIFIPRPGFYVTPILIDLNILVWLVMLFSGVHWLAPDTESLINWGANFRPLTLEGEWWRLLTNCFLHIGVLHLLMNMYALLYIGILLEPLLGSLRFISAYLLTGITASIASLWWHDLTVSAGASGAIFGMYGVFLAMLSTNLIEKSTRKALLASIGLFVGYNLLYGMKGGIDNAAHIGGLVGGIIIGYAYIPSLKKPEESQLKFWTIGILTLIILVSSFVFYKKLPNDIGKYGKKMEQFALMEQKALKIFGMPRNSPKEKLLSEIKDSGLYYWRENVKLLNEVEKLNLPEQFHKKNKIILQYCKIRILSYEFIYKAIEEDSDQYQLQIDEYNIQIEETLNKLRSLAGEKQ
ncbi:MAG: rhomboid family intramembrane serine protease [Bacteroidota bacterium]